jgi:hypothetical protein
VHFNLYVYLALLIYETRRTSQIHTG